MINIRIVRTKKQPRKAPPLMPRLKTATDFSSYYYITVWFIFTGIIRWLCKIFHGADWRRLLVQFYVITVHVQDQLVVSVIFYITAGLDLIK